jgi:hypothetical protein
MSKIKPVRYAAVVLTYLCASGFGTPPAGIVRTLPGYNMSPVVRRSPSGHTPFSPPRLLNHWHDGASSIDEQSLFAASASLTGYALNGSGLFAYQILQ